MTKASGKGTEVQVTNGLPKLEVEILPDVHAFIDGKLVEPGERAVVDGPCALNLVALNHAKLVDGGAADA